MPQTIDAIIVGSRARRPRRRRRAGGRRQTGADRRPGARGSLGGQAFWSFGGLFLVDSPEQRRMGVKDSLDLARQDWFGSAGSTATRTTGRGAGPRPTCDFAAGEKRSWLREKGVALLPRRRLGRARRRTPPTGTATRCRASTSPGAPAPASSSRSTPGARGRAGRARHAPAPAPGRRAHRRRDGAVTGVRGRACSRPVERRTRARPARARSSATSSSRRRP